jgi:2-oxoisovalerate dehydrogenase E1 component
MKTYKHQGVAISSQGESSVSEGYCYEAINGADRELLPVIFVFQDNGYGISVPKWNKRLINAWPIILEVLPI